MAFFHFPKQECCLQGLDSVFGMQPVLPGNGFSLQREVLRPSNSTGEGLGETGVEGKGALFEKNQTNKLVSHAETTFKKWWLHIERKAS